MKLKTSLVKHLFVNITIIVRTPRLIWPLYVLINQIDSVVGKDITLTRRYALRESNPNYLSSFCVIKNIWVLFLLLSLFKNL